MFEKLASLPPRLDALDRQLMDPAVARDRHRYAEISREAARVRGIVDCWEEHKRLSGELTEAREMASQEDDPEMREMAREEATELESTLQTTTEKLRLLLLPPDPYEGRPLLLEVRAGTGGDEAALFAGDLARMYQRFSESKGLKFELLSANTISVGGSGKTLQGFKEVVASVSGAEAYNLLRFEAGVHRVQRVPATESQGRIHTSAATVAVMPEPDEVEINIDAKDIRIDTMRAGGPGGQSVNTTDSAVRIVHIETGLTVICQDEKSQHKNRDKAMRVLKARLLEKEHAERAAAESAARKAMVGSGDRSERIRTYNFPQNRITDHRIGATLYKLDSVIEGNLDELVGLLIAARQAEQLAASDLV